jgi:hypothetical protein
MILYQGTSKENWNKIQEIGYIGQKTKRCPLFLSSTKEYSRHCAEDKADSCVLLEVEYTPDENEKLYTHKVCFIPAERLQYYGPFQVETYKKIELKNIKVIEFKRFGIKYWEILDERNNKIEKGVKSNY